MELATYVSEIIRSRGIRLPRLAKMVGYRNITKGVRRLECFLGGGPVHEWLLESLISVLQLDREKVIDLIREDRRQFLQEWNEWADTPVRARIVKSRVGPFCHAELLAPGISQEAAEQYASRVAKELNHRIHLIFNRRLAIWFDADGKRGEVTEATPGDCVTPYLRVKSRCLAFDLDNNKTEMLKIPAMPGPKEEVITKFGNVQLRSSFQMNQDESGNVVFNIEGPVLEQSDDGLTVADCHNGMETVLEGHDVRLALDQLAKLRDSLDCDAILGSLSGQDQVEQMLGKIEDELIARGVVQEPKYFSIGEP